MKYIKYIMMIIVLGAQTMVFGMEIGTIPQNIIPQNIEEKLWSAYTSHDSRVLKKLFNTLDDNQQHKIMQKFLFYPSANRARNDAYNDSFKALLPLLDRANVQDLRDLAHMTGFPGKVELLERYLEELYQD